MNNHSVLVDIISSFLLILSLGVFVNVALLSSKRVKINGKIVSVVAPTESCTGRIIFALERPLVIRCGLLMFKETKDQIEIRFDSVDAEEVEKLYNLTNRSVEIVVTNDRLIMSDYYQGHLKDTKEIPGLNVHGFSKSPFS